MHRTFIPSLALLFGVVSSVCAQTAPGIGYVYPPGAAAGSTVEVRLAGYDWTPDLQFFVHDPRVKLEIIEAPGEVLVPQPPYWFGQPSFASAWPMPREVSARITIPKEIEAGPIEWQVANANGTSALGKFIIGAGAESREEALDASSRKLPALPVTVSGRLGRIEEVDRYRFSIPQTGPVTCELHTNLGGAFNGVLEVRDRGGKTVADAADTVGKSTLVTFTAQADHEYDVFVRDIEFRGNRAFVYRLGLHPGPRVLGAVPTAGTRGETRDVRFVGLGIATGKSVLESVTRQVVFESEQGSAVLPFVLQTPFGTARPIELSVSDLPERVENDQVRREGLMPPMAVTGVIDRRGEIDRYPVALKKGDPWRIAVRSRRAEAPLDLALAIHGPDGKPVANNDDAGGSPDPLLDFTAPEDGTYELRVRDLSGRSADPSFIYRLIVDAPKPGGSADFAVQVPRNLNVPIGGKADLTVTVTRRADFKAPVALKIVGLPAGVGVPADLIVPADKGELKVPLQCAESAAAFAAVATVTGVGVVDGKELARTGPSLLVATTMKPRAKVTPVDKDGGRTVHAGTTFPAELIIERMEGFEGEVILEMASAQSRHRQGIRGPEMTVPTGVTKMHYPVFMPEWLETIRTSRMILNAVAKVPDPKGNIRNLVNRMDGRITMSVEGALLKISPGPGELRVRAGESFDLPLKVLRSAKLDKPVRLEARLVGETEGLLRAESIEVAPNLDRVSMRVESENDQRLLGEQTIRIRATALQAGDLPVVSEVTVPVLFLGAR